MMLTTIELLPRRSERLCGIRNTRTFLFAR